MGCRNSCTLFAAFIWRFSTLYGSKWVAAGVAGAGVAGAGGFSTLYGSKWVAAFEVAEIINLDGRFQYPLRVEVGCSRCLPMRHCLPSSFSTLYGSKWVATNDGMTSGVEPE